MPFYYWYGTDVLGRLCSGEQCARDEEHLRIKLKHKQIELLEWRSTFIKQSVPFQDKVHFFHHLARLLHAHVRMHEALLIVATITTNQFVKAIAYDCADSLTTGMRLSDCMRAYPQLADDLCVTLITAGEHSGDLSQALNDLVAYYHSREMFNREIRSLLLMPFFTFIFFIIILIGLLVFVIPRYAFFFNSLKGELPQSTRMILAFSAWLRSYASLYTVILLMSIAGCLTIYRHTAFIQRIMNWLVLTIPGIRSLIILITQARVLHIVSLLYRARVPILNIFPVISQSITNVYIKRDIDVLAQRIAAGYSLAQAWGMSTYFNAPEVEALLTVGQSTGDMQSMLHYAASWYQERVKQVMERMITIIQPVVLVLLGLLIAGLIIAVYMPLFSLSTLVTS